MGPAQPHFELEWPPLSARLRALLASKNVPESRRDDLVQETGLRLFRSWPTLRPGRSPWPLAVTILLNLVRDEARRNRSAPLVFELPELADTCDVERAGLARLELARVRRAMSELSSAHRAALLLEVSGAGGDRATKMQRLRARRRLNAMLERVPAGGFVAVWCCRIVRRARGVPAERTATAASLGVPAAGLLAVLALFSLSGEPGNSAATPHAAGRPEQSVEALQALGAAARSRPPDDLPAVPTARGASRSVRGSGAGAVSAGGYRVPLSEDVWVETEADVSLLGIGLGVRDGDGDLPLCVRSPAAGPSTCPSKGGRATDGPASIAGRVGAGVRYGEHEVLVEHGLGSEGSSSP